MVPILLVLLPIHLGGSVSRPYSGDAEFARMEYTRAEAVYDSTLRTSADSAQFLWRLARLYVMRGEIAEADTKQQLFHTAEAYARRCIMADSNLAAGHTWRAAALGNIAMFEGSTAKVRLCHDIKGELDRAIALDSTDDVAYSILGSFYMALGNVSWIERRLAGIFLGSLPEGGYEEAEVALQHAIALAPTVIRHTYELGMLYKAEGRTQEAREAFRRVGELPALCASDARTKAHAAEWVRTLKD